MASFRDITLGQYVPGTSLVHQIDARMKIIAAAVLSVSVFAVADFRGYGLLAAFILAVAACARLPLSMLWQGIRPLLLLIVMTAVVHVLFTPGTVLWTAGPLRITEQGVVTAARMALRLVLLLSGVSLLTLTTSPLSLTDGLERLLGPLRRVGVPAHEIAMMMTIALRFIPTLMEELEKITKAQIARGADLESGGVVGRMRALIPLLVPLFTGVFRRAEELAVAMEARAYRGGEGRTKMWEPVLRLRDFLALAATVLVGVAAVWLG